LRTALGIFEVAIGVVTLALAFTFFRKRDRQSATLMVAATAACFVIILARR